VRPPLHAVGLVEVDADLLARGRGLERPGGFVEEDGFREGALLLRLDAGGKGAGGRTSR
jgi:hypothetical protein